MMTHNADPSRDNELMNINGLAWLPWIGADYFESSSRLLVVGESHYLKEGTDEEHSDRLIAEMNNNGYTRECIHESQICEDWSVNTYDNLNRALVGTNSFEKKLVWSGLSYYNFIQKLMDYREQERPLWHDYYSAWRVFVDMVKILCLSASFPKITRP